MTCPDRKRARRRGSWYLTLGGCLAMAASIGIGRFVYTPILPLMIAETPLSKAWAGLIASANFLGYLAGALAAARTIAADRRRTWLIGAVLISGITTAGMAVDNSVLTLSLLRIIGGGASAYVIVLASNLVLERLAGSGHGSLAPVHFAGVGVGIFVSAAIVSVIIAVDGGWRAAWAAAGGAALIMTMGVAWLIPAANPMPVSRAIPVLSAGPSKGLAAWIAAYGLVGFGYVITATFLVTIVRLSPDIRPAEAWIWMLTGAAAAVSVALWSWLAGRIGHVFAFAAAGLIEAFGVAASTEWPTLTGVCIAALCLGGTFMGLTALGLIRAGLLAPDRPGRVFALMTASFGLGQIIGPTVAGVLSEYWGGFRVPSLIAALALVAASGLAIVSRGTARRG